MTAELTPKTIREHILIVDDDPDVCEVLQEILQNHTNCQTSVAYSGEEALHLMRKENFCLVFTDFKMSKELDGLELVQKIKKKSPKTLPVMITGSNDIEVVLKALRGGAFNFIRKPFEICEVLDVVEKVLSMAVARVKEQQVFSFLVQETKNFIISNEMDNVNPLIDILNENVVGVGICKENQIPNLSLVLTEAIANAIEHGNLELSSELKKKGKGKDSEFSKLKQKRLKDPSYNQRKSYVHRELTQDFVKYIIRDEGKGFDYHSIPDPRLPDNMFKVHGRGLMLIQAIMDEVSFNEMGNEIMMLKYREGSPKSKFFQPKS
ncbi:MAG: response regulator [Planctomycetota bacterium]